MSGVAMGDWFFTVNGEQKGPVSREELGHLAQAGAIHPRNDMVWQQGMEAWVAACELDGLFQRKAPEQVVEPVSQMAATATNPGGAVDPYAAGGISEFEHGVTTHWPGVGRGGFFMATTVLPIAGQFALAFLALAAGGMLGENGPMVITLGGTAALMALVLYGVFQRFPNLGMSRWWAFGLVVPFLSWWVYYRLFACPPGYAMHKKLDTLGWVLAVLYWLSVLASLVLLVTVLVLMGAALADPEAWEGIMEAAAAGEAAAGG
jgi:hypothetical protein